MATTVTAQPSDERPGTASRTDVEELATSFGSAEQPATTLCKSHPQSDTILNPDSVAADPDFCAQCWRTSEDCQHVIQVFLSLRANRIPHHSALQGILAQELPPLFIVQNQKDAFFALLQRETISDVKLLDAFIDFLATWKSQRLASYRDLLADSKVAREAAALLPAIVPLWMWIQKRLRGQIELIIVHGTDPGPRLSCVVQSSCVPRTPPPLARLAEMNGGQLFLEMRTPSHLGSQVACRARCRGALQSDCGFCSARGTPRIEVNEDGVETLARGSLVA